MSAQDAQPGLHEVYENPFHAMLDFGEEWATDGMTADEMSAAAQQIGGVVLSGTRHEATLHSFATEFIDRQRSQNEGEQ